jgi:hypothetical protein
MTNHGNHTTLMVGAAAVFLVLAALGVPVLAYLPLLAIVAICPLMMVMMMRGMDHGGGSSKDDDADAPTNTHRH